MTSREQQILEWIKQNPMISQNELANLAGITRSGVAAHISNLVKKGYLQGKGYVITPPRYITVVGGVNMDILGISRETVTTPSSYPGKIYNKLGGVGRNVAVNLSKMDVHTFLVSAYGDDRNGELFKEDALDNQVDISHSKQVSGATTSMYLYVNQPRGDRVLGIDDMEINAHISPEFLRGQEQTLNNSELVIFDSNLPKKSIKWLYNNVRVPMFAKAVGLNKMMNLYDGMGHLDTLVINGVEASALTKMKVYDEKSAREGVKRLLARGVKNVFLYMEGIGILYQSMVESHFFSDHEKNPRNTNGAGASATAALAWARLQRQSFLEAGQAGVAAAYITTESYDAVNPDISVELLTSIQKKIKAD